MTDPTPKHTTGLDLDAIEDDGAIRTPYDFRFAGETWTGYDPDRLDWRVVAALDNNDAREVLQIYMEPGDFTRFLLLDPAPQTWQVKRLISALNRHFFGSEQPAGE